MTDRPLQVGVALKETEREHISALILVAHVLFHDGEEATIQEGRWTIRCEVSVCRVETEWVEGVVAPVKLPGHSVAVSK